MSRYSSSQFEAFSLKGYWWLPASTERVAGELHYSESDITLSLYGGLGPAEVETPFSSTPLESEIPLIHGVSDDDTPVTILTSFYTKWKSDIGSLKVKPREQVPMRSSELHSGFVLLGAHVSLDELSEFSKIRVEVPHLAGWLGVEPFEVKIENGIQRIILTQEVPDTEEHDLKRLQCRLRFIHAAVPPALPLSSNPTVSHRTYVEIEPQQSESLRRLLNRSSAVVEFLSVAYGGPLMSSRNMVFLNSTRQSMDVYYPRHAIEPRGYSIRDYLLPYESIRAIFPTICENWLKAHDNNERARSMLISGERRPSDFIELRFLPLAQAAEVLSNDAQQTTFVDATEFTRLRDAMLAALGEDAGKDLQNSIKNSLQWANGRSLREKLRSLLGELEEETVSLFAGSVEDFIAGIVLTRNHYTHYSTKPGQLILQGMELHWAIQKLSLMIRIVLLIRAGVPETSIQTQCRQHLKLSKERTAWTKVSERGSKYFGDGPDSSPPAETE